MKIKCAAICTKEGRIFIGDSHAQIIRQWGTETKGGQQGFCTDTGLFINRVQALKIAEKAGQIKEKHPPYNQLFSEDLYKGE